MRFTLVLIKPSLHGVNVAQQIHHEALKNQLENHTSPYLVMVTEIAHFLVEYMLCFRYPNVFIIECRVDKNIQRRNPTSFKHASLSCLLFNSHQTTYQPNLGVRLRKTNDLRPTIYLRLKPHGRKLAWTSLSWRNSIGSNEQVVATWEELWGVATMTF